VLPGAPWRSLALPGAPWFSLALPGALWRSLTLPGAPWRSLVLPGAPWCSLALRGTLRLVIPDTQTTLPNTPQIIENLSQIFPLWFCLTFVYKISTFCVLEGLGTFPGS
jgi:hypothetical protein